MRRSLYLLSLIEKRVDETPSILVPLLDLVESQGIFAENRRSPQAQRKNYQQCILCLLRHELSESLLQYVLLKAPTDILPYLSTPVQLADYLVDCYNYGGMVSVLALGGLFTLITEYNVNYPNYYNKLYQLLTPEAFRLKYRQQFLSLLVQSLRSSNISASVVAAFCKRLCRLAVTESPATALFVIPLVTELITYHSVLYPLLQVKDPQDIYEVVNHRKPLPGVEAEEMEVKRQKELVDEEEVSSEGRRVSAGSRVDDDSDEEEEEEKEEVAEVADNRMVEVERPSAVLSSDILKLTLERMKLKREQHEREAELPPKRVKKTFHFASRFGEAC